MEDLSQYQRLTIPQLKALCKERGYIGYSKLKKSALAEFLALKETSKQDTAPRTAFLEQVNVMAENTLEAASNGKEPSAITNEQPSSSISQLPSIRIRGPHLKELHLIVDLGAQINNSPNDRNFSTRTTLTRDAGTPRHTINEDDEFTYRVSNASPRNDKPHQAANGYVQSRNQDVRLMDGHTRKQDDEEQNLFQVPSRFPLDEQATRIVSPTPEQSANAILKGLVVYSSRLAVCGHLSLLIVRTKKYNQSAHIDKTYQMVLAENSIPYFQKYSQSPLKRTQTLVVLIHPWILFLPKVWSFPCERLKRDSTSLLSPHPSLNGSG